MWFTSLDNIHAERYLTHQLLWGFFPEQQKQGAKRPFCYLEAGDKIYMLSNVEPKTESRKIELETNRSYTFYLSASYNRRLSGRDENGKRIYHKKPDISDAKQLQEWLERRLEDTAAIQFVNVKKMPPHSVTRKDGKKMVWPQNQFMGTLNINKPQDFLHIISTGIGSASGFGLGAMILPEVMK